MGRGNRIRKRKYMNVPLNGPANEIFDGSLLQVKSRLRVRNMEVDSSYSYYSCRGHVGPCVQCPSQWGK